MEDADCGYGRLEMVLTIQSGRELRVLCRGSKTEGGRSEWTERKRFYRKVDGCGLLVNPGFGENWHIITS
jgi:hypothetical protein